MSLASALATEGHSAGVALAPRALRVGFVVHVMQIAGAEVLVAETIRRLQGKIEPTIFCLDSVGRLGEQLQAQGVAVVCLDRRPGRDWRVAWRLAREIRSRKVDVLHAHQYTPFFYSALARVLLGGGVRLILTEHGRHYPDVVRPLRRAVNRLLLDRLADAVNACCAFSADGLARVDGFAAGRIEIIENGIDLERYQARGDRAALRDRLGLERQRRYIATVARFHPVKDHVTLLRAFAVIATDLPDVDLLLAGDGPLRADLERLAAELGIDARVRFLGIRSDVPDLLQAADAFALTSVSEAASLTLLEALASSVPVVVTDVGGNPEIVRNGVDGLLAPRGDAPAIAKALRTLLDDPERATAMGAAGRARVEEHYQLQHTVAAYHDLYRRVTGGARSDRAVRPRGRIATSNGAAPA
jgi:glycosyltransferase involved in cell wall biosynthesis